jgi:DNA-binding NarL/FixJ family response regulator
VVVAVRHPGLQRLIVELLDREHGCWRARARTEPLDLVACISTDRPDLVVVDAADFPGCCRRLLDSFPAARVVVIGPEPDSAYEHAARRGGAGGWLASDRIAEDLSRSMRMALGCTHWPCPTPRTVVKAGEEGEASEAASSSPPRSSSPAGVKPEQQSLHDRELAGGHRVEP